MSRKDYEAIASIIHDRFSWLDKEQNKAVETGVFTTGHDTGFVSALETVAVELADHFETDNPRFDRARFLAACGL